VDTLSYKTKSAKPSDIKRDWYVIDATNKPLGRLSTLVAHHLRGKNKAYYTPHMDCGDYVIVLNAGEVKLSGNKRFAKEYITFSGYPSGQKKIVADKLFAKNPLIPVERAVRGMLPKNKLGRQMFKKLFVYAGSKHPHSAQKPHELKF
jgi:large subunit ribosomal protein L13